MADEKSVAQHIEELKAACDKSRTFKEAYEKGLPFHHIHHRCYVIASSIINVKTGCSEFHSSPEVVAELTKLGAKRSTRAVYDNHGKPERSVSVWVFRE